MFAEFRHVSRQKVQCITRPLQNSTYKPRGLYFARGRAWLDFCRANFETEDWTMPYCYALEAKKDFNVLTLTPDNAKEVYQKFQAPPEEHRLLQTKGMDWKRISELYDGVHITQELVNLDTELFSVYDVETLVIWDESATLVEVDFMRDSPSVTSVTMTSGDFSTTIVAKDGRAGVTKEQFKTAGDECIQQ